LRRISLKSDIVAFHKTVARFYYYKNVLKNHKKYFFVFFSFLRQIGLHIPRKTPIIFDLFIVPPGRLGGAVGGFHGDAQ